MSRNYFVLVPANVRLSLVRIDYFENCENLISICHLVICKQLSAPDPGNLYRRHSVQFSCTYVLLLTVYYRTDWFRSSGFKLKDTHKARIRSLKQLINVKREKPTFI